MNPQDWQRVVKVCAATWTYIQVCGKLGSAQALEVEQQQTSTSSSSEALQALMSQAKFQELLAQVHERSGEQSCYLERLDYLSTR